MHCPKCEDKVSAVIHKIGFLRVSEFHCHCGTKWVHVEAEYGFDKPLFTEELERLSGRYAGVKPVHVRSAIHYLRHHLDEQEKVTMSEEAVKTKTRNDWWERMLLKRLIGEEIF